MPCCEPSPCRCSSPSLPAWWRVRFSSGRQCVEQRPPEADTSCFTAEGREGEREGGNNTYDSYLCSNTEKFLQLLSLTDVSGGRRSESKVKVASVIFKSVIEEVTCHGAMAVFLCGSCRGDGSHPGTVCTSSRIPARQSIHLEVK